jgi:hypothetical protein
MKPLLATDTPKQKPAFQSASSLRELAEIAAQLLSQLSVYVTHNKGCERKHPTARV